MESVAIEVHSAPQCDVYSACASPAPLSGFDTSSSTLDVSDIGALCSEILFGTSAAADEQPSDCNAPVHSLNNAITTETPGDVVSHNKNKNGRYIVFPIFTALRSLVKPVLHFELPEWGYSHRGGDVLLCQSTSHRK